MQDGQTSFYIISAFSSVIVILISAFKFIERKTIAFKHLAQFLVLMHLGPTIAYALIHKNPLLLGLYTFTWLLVLKGCIPIFEDLIKVPLKTKHMMLTAYISVGMAVVVQIFVNELKWVMVPMALFTTFTGLYFVFQAYQQKSAIQFSPLHHLNFLAMGGYFLSRTFLPLILTEYSFQQIIIIDCTFSLFFSLSLFPLFTAEIFEKHEKLLENAVEVRNEQLFNHTNFSEFKILSAGVVHEINNALTIINAKVEQMLRASKEFEQEKGLRLILTSTNRINKSVKGLREFIYPNETWENLEMDEIFRHILSLYGQRLKNHEVKLTIKGFKGKHINGNRTQIEQVFLSLLNLSVGVLDNMEERWIEIIGAKHRTNLEIMFKDSGPDLESHLVKMLQAPTISLEDDVKEGIRLMQAKKIIELHGGTLEYVQRGGNLVCLIKLPLSSQSDKHYPFSQPNLDSNSGQHSHH
ncbi:MAG TPA: HAMP domain-containing sensor histidine kinase [Bacteriovoracaceae bacterium]|nr:HAMP domain-containing sensor histidine kinase [Bacteriovoracaceae bacterium]